MLTRQFTRRLLSPADVSPSRDDLEVIGVFNPAAVALRGHPDHADGTIVLMARVAERPTDQRPGFHALPRWEAPPVADALGSAGQRRSEPGASATGPVPGQLVVEHLPAEEDILVDPRKVVRKRDQLMRLKFVSHIRVFTLTPDGQTVTGELPPLLCQGPCETFGVEDPRITAIADQQGNTTYWITYVSVSEHGACTSLATTRDFRTYDRLGVCFAPENKDVVLCPEKVDGRYVALHRPNTFQRFCKPEMWAATSIDGRDWGAQRPVWHGRHPWDGDRIGAGTPPIVLDDDTLLEVYHGSEPSHTKGKVGAYRAGLLTLARAEPWKVVAHTPEPVMQAEEPWEMDGFVPDVVFPTGIVLPGVAHNAVPGDDDEALVFYGAADTHVGVTAYRVGEMRAALQPM